jgi:hypothetical protein
MASKAASLLLEGKTLPEVRSELPQTRNPVVWRKVHELLKDWKGMDADIMRAVVRAARMKVLSDSLSSGDTEMVLRAADQIAGDPEVALKTPPQTVVNIDFGPVEELLTRLETYETTKNESDQ